MTTVPSEVGSALAKRMDKVKTATNDRIQTNRVAPGDIRIIQGLPHMPTDSRLGLVVAVDSEFEFTEVLLIHTAPELASNADVIVARTTAGSPYDIVVQTDLRAVVWTWQLGTTVGWLNQTDLRTLRSLAGGVDGGNEMGLSASNARSLSTGLSLAGPSDPRWSFKQAEGEALRLLAEDCTSALLDRELVWQVDPELLHPELLDRTAAPLDVVEELMHWAMTRTLTIGEADLIALAETGALKVDAWESLGDLASDVWLGLQDVILGAATGVKPGHSQLTSQIVTASHLKFLDDTNYDRVHVFGRREAVNS